jgi:hypothetical protein
MLAERRKLSATLISRTVKGTLLALLSLSVLFLAGAPGEAGRNMFKSPEIALEQGIGAMRAGNYELALPALQEASEANGRIGFLGKFYLARLLADNQHTYTDHARAYMLYQAIADQYADVDPDDDSIAPFVAKAFMALARYMKSGLDEIGLKPNPVKAAQYMFNAATTFSDPDAQFELAKMFLTGDGVDIDARRAVHWLSVLSQRGHAPAQAVLADIYWRGKHLPRDVVKAILLGRLAVENAPESERIWIEDIYQRIYCGSPDTVQADAQVADWRRKYGTPTPPRSQQDGTLMPPKIERVCSDGRPVLLPPIRAHSQAEMPQVASPGIAPSSRAPSAIPPSTLLEVGGKSRDR